MNPFPTLAPDFAHPIAMLRACHDKIERFCSLISRLPGYLKEHGADTSAQEAAKQILRYFQVAAPLHHQDEEEDFFPLLRRYLPHTESTLSNLEAEHRILEETWSILEKQLENLEYFDCSENSTATRFTEAYRKHMAIENILFDQAEMLIPAAELYEAGRKMSARRIG